MFDETSRKVIRILNTAARRPAQPGLRVIVPEAGTAMINTPEFHYRDNWKKVTASEVKGARLFIKLQSLIDEVNITDVRGRGLMFAIDFCNKSVGDSVYLKLLDRGYIVCNRKSLFRIDPPLTVNEDEFIDFIRDFRNIF